MIDYRRTALVAAYFDNDGNLIDEKPLVSIEVMAFLEAHYNLGILLAAPGATIESVKAQRDVVDTLWSLYERESA